MRKIKLPEHMVQGLINLPEHGMGYQRVIVELFNADSFRAILYNCEYLEIPNKIETDDIKKINYRH